MRPRKDPTRRNQILISVFFAAIMVFSTFGFFAGQNAGANLTYGKHKFEQTQSGMFQTKVDGRYFSFFFLPSAVDALEFPQGAAGLLRTPTVIVTFDPAMTDANLQLADQLRLDLTRLGVYVQPGTTKNSSLPFPVLTCQNATATQPAVFLQEANGSNATLEGSCLVLQGNGTDLFQLRDRLFYEYFGVRRG